MTYPTVIARRGTDWHLIQIDATMGRVTDGETVFSPLPKDSILARGYWEPFSGDPKPILALLKAHTSPPSQKKEFVASWAKALGDEPSDLLTMNFSHSIPHPPLHPRCGCSLLPELTEVAVPVIVDTERDAGNAYRNVIGKFGNVNPADLALKEAREAWRAMNQTLQQHRNNLTVDQIAELTQRRKVLAQRVRTLNKPMIPKPTELVVPPKPAVVQEPAVRIVDGVPSFREVDLEKMNFEELTAYRRELSDFVKTDAFDKMPPGFQNRIDLRMDKIASEFPKAMLRTVEQNNAFYTKESSDVLAKIEARFTPERLKELRAAADQLIDDQQWIVDYRAKTASSRLYENPEYAKRLMRGAGSDTTLKIASGEHKVAVEKMIRAETPKKGFAFDIRGKAPNSNPEVVQNWIRTHVDQKAEIGRVDLVYNSPQFEKDPREYYRSMDGRHGQSTILNPNGINIGDRTTRDTIAHEFGHHVQDGSGSVRIAENTFRMKRTVGEETQKLKELTGIDQYKTGEIGRRDRFIDPYTGKEYSAWASQLADTEVVSMGMQMMYENPTLFALRDPEYFKFTLDIMHGRAAQIAAKIPRLS